MGGLGVITVKTRHNLALKIRDGYDGQIHSLTDGRVPPIIQLLTLSVYSRHRSVDNDIPRKGGIRNRDIARGTAKTDMGEPQSWLHIQLEFSKQIFSKRSVYILPLCSTVL